jgi:hypothetical protein
MSANGRQPSSLVRNAADPKQVKFAEQFEKRRDERFRVAIASVMATQEGRAVLAGLIRRAGVYRSVWSPSSEIHYNAGRQDYGHELMADLVAVDEDLYQLMEREEWAWAKSQQASISATHTRRSTEPEEENGR